MLLLIIRFSSAGDIILTSPFVRALRAKYPQAVIHYAVRSEFTPLVAHSPHIDKVIPIERDWGLRRLLKFKSELLKTNGDDYAIVFDLHNSLRSRYFRLGLGLQSHVVHKPTLKKQLLVRRKINRLLPAVSMADRYLQTGADYGLRNDGLGLELFTGNALPPILPVEYPTVALAPGARHFTKRWPPEYFTALGSMLCHTMNARIVLVGSTEERELCSAIARGIDGQTVNLAGRASMLESALALDACDVVVANDSAVTHMAAARKRPVVALFGSTVQEFGFAPYGTPSVVVEQAGLPCRPCTTIGRESCPKGHFNCMKELLPERVLSAVQTLYPRNY